MRREYEHYLDSHMQQAMHETNGVLLNSRASARCVPERTVFLSNSRYANAHASPELKDFWSRNPRMTLSDFERQWVNSLEAHYEGIAL